MIFLFNSLLITPIQRPPRYKLLLTELLKLTPEDHPDREDLQKALLAVEKVRNRINCEFCGVCVLRQMI